MDIGYKLDVLWCRTFQAVLKVGNYFMGYRMPHYLEGPGKIAELGKFLAEKKINDVLVVTGSGMVRRGQVKPMLDGFDAAGIRYTLKTYDTTDPTSDDVEAGFKTYKENGCKSIVALGGGSRIDCAKGIAAKAVHPKKTVSQLQGLLKVHWPIPPFVAIPTTAGTGSEVTPFAVITDERGRDIPVTMSFKWPVKRAVTCYSERLAPVETMETKVRLIDSFFPVAKGGTYCIPGPFGAGKTVLQHALSQFAEADVVIIGENWHDANSNLRGDQYDSIMNYAFTKACLDYFATETIDAKQMAWRLNGLLMRNTDMVNNMMLNLLDSHDTHRFFKEVNSNPKKMKSALALLYLFKGAPNIFYGTERYFGKMRPHPAGSGCHLG